MKRLHRERNQTTNNNPNTKEETMVQKHYTKEPNRNYRVKATKSEVS